MYNIGAFNTDGFDVAGKNVWIHDCNIWNDDDCIAVKSMNKNGNNAQCSENMLFERINASGLGLTIGSIGSSINHDCVRNITFRDCKMENTFKGIYLKSRSGIGTGEISNILYENIEIDSPTQWAIWIGPQQAIYKNECNLLWPFLGKCPVPNNVTFSNITLRNISINSPKISPGIILGNVTNPMKNITFDNVYVKNPSLIPNGNKYYRCENSEINIKGNT